jgi:hypothetical protein
VYTRRGIPRRPEMCIGKKVTLKPMKISQKDSFPRPSRYIRPYIFGIQ